MNVYVLPRASDYSRPLLRRKHTVSSEVKIGIVTLCFTLIGLISLLSFESLRHTTKIQAAGYEIKKLEQQKNSLLNTHKSLTMEIARKQSLAALDESEQVKGMQIIDHPNIVSTKRNLALK